jgi:predicted DNA-binding WGR domain protein
MPTTVKSVSLLYKDEKSDKEYNVTLEKVESWIDDNSPTPNFLVNFTYGKRGNAVATGTKTPTKVPFEAALKIYNKLVEEKTGKGYKPSDMIELTINVVTRLQDNGDGGYTMYVYNNEDELIADHPKSEDFRQGPDGKWDYVKVKLTKEQRDEILNEEDAYENGYIGSDTIKVKIVNGVATLAEPMSFHAGQ